MNVYEQVTDNIVAMMEQGDVPPWRKDWTGGSIQIPHNGVTKHIYQGINVWNLTLTGMCKGYSSNEWATYKQWQSAGGQVRKGERSTVAVFFKPITKIDDSGEETSFNVARSFSVFNRDQVDGLPEAPVTPSDEGCIENEGLVMEMPNAMGVAVREGQPSYSPTLDTIEMPKPGSFTSLEGYYATMAHECSHATGHESRLNRNFGKRFGDDEYAMEELVAELSAAYLCAKAGIPYDLQQHASYLTAWINRLKQDPRAIFNVAAAAQRAADHVSESLAAYRLINEQESELGRLMA